MTCMPANAQYVVSDKYDLWFEDTDNEVRQMFADANLSHGSMDARILKGYSMDDIDLGTLHDYRKAYDKRHENHPWSDLSDMEFLKKVEAW